MVSQSCASWRWSHFSPVRRSALPLSLPGVPSRPSPAPFVHLSSSTDSLTRPSLTPVPSIRSLDTFPLRSLVQTAGRYPGNSGVSKQIIKSHLPAASPAELILILAIRQTTATLPEDYRDRRTNPSHFSRKSIFVPCQAVPSFPSRFRRYEVLRINSRDIGLVPCQCQR